MDDLLVEDGKHVVRFVRVASGGVLGLGETKFLENKPLHLHKVYDHYGTLPFWSDGYVSPLFPYFR